MIMINEEMILFQSFIRVCNLNAKGSAHWQRTISRQDIRELYPSARMNTLDGYRRMLCAAGYMESDGHGVYEMLKEIPEEMTLTRLRDEAYGNAKS